jgi:hypothetical protein
MMRELWTLAHYARDVIFPPEPTIMARTKNIVLLLAGPAIIRSTDINSNTQRNLTIAWLVVMLGFVNPYRRFRRDHAGIRKGLTVGPIDIESTSTAGVYAVIRIENPGSLPILGVRGIIEECLALDNVSTVPPGHLQWSTRSGKGVTSVIDANPFETHYLDLAYLDPGHRGGKSEWPSTWPMRLVYAGGEEHREAQSLPRGEYLITVGLLANLLEPQYFLIFLSSPRVVNRLQATLLMTHRNKNKIINERDAVLASLPRNKA